MFVYSAGEPLFVLTVIYMSLLSLIIHQDVLH